MKHLRVWIAAGLLVSELLLVCMVYGKVRRISGELGGLQKAAADAVLQGEDARGALAALCDGWEQRLPFLHLTVPGQALAELDINMARLLPLYDAGSDELNAELSTIETNLQRLAKREKSIF